MQGSVSKHVVAAALAAAVANGAHAGGQGEVKGSFVLHGVEARLAHVRAQRATLDAKGKAGYSILLSERPAQGDLDAWRTADPAERGSFIFVQLEQSGDVWVAELGHSARKGGRFGVVAELRKVAFDVKGDSLTARLSTEGEQEFGGDRYSIDLTFSAPLEPAMK